MALFSRLTGLLLLTCEINQKCNEIVVFYNVLCVGWDQHVRPGVENARNELPGLTFGHICGQGLEMLKISFLGLLLAISAARGWKCSKVASWGYFWPYLRPGAGNVQN